MDEIVWTLPVPAYALVPSADPEADITLKEPLHVRRQLASVYRTACSHDKVLLEALYADLEVLEGPLDEGTFPLSLDPAARQKAVTAVVCRGLQVSKEYDARHRVVARGVARLLDVPWAAVAAAEAILMQAMLETAGAGHSGTVTSSQPGKIKRALVIGGFTVVGGAVLFLTGGLTAPLILPAIHAVGAGTVAVATSVGLGTAATGIVVYTAAVMAYLSIPVLTAMLGVGGAGLCGYKAARRTAGCDDFQFLKIADIDYPATCEYGAPETLRMTDPDAESDTPQPGPVVALRTRSAAMKNLKEACLSDYKVVAGVDNRHPSVALELRHGVFSRGTWGFTPPLKIPPNSAGTFLGRNRSYRLTGVGLCVVYSLPGVCDVVVAVGNPLVGACVAHGSVVVPPIPGDITTHNFTPYFNAMSAARGQGAATLGETNTTIHLTWSGVDDKVFTLASIQTEGPSDTTDRALCPVLEARQTSDDVRTALCKSSRRVVVLALANKYPGTLRVVEAKALAGTLSISNAAKKTPAHVEPSQALVIGATNKWGTLGGAGLQLLVEGPDFSLTVQAANSSVQGTVTAAGSFEDGQPLATVSPLIFTTPAGRNLVLSWTVQDNVCVLFRLEEVAAGGNSSNAMHVTIGVNGFINIIDARFRKEEQVAAYWYPHLKAPTILGADLCEGYCLQWEVAEQLNFGATLAASCMTAVVKFGKGKVRDEAVKHVLQGILAASVMTVLAAVKIPSYIVTAAGAIDNNFIMLQNRAEHAGAELASALMSRAHGHRPVSFIAVSCGACLVMHCLIALAKAGAVGIVENVFLLGCTRPTSPETWRAVRGVVAGRLVNVFSRKDWFLAFLFRANGTFRPVPGLSRVRNVVGVENVDCSAYIPEHVYYSLRLGEVLTAIPPNPTAETLNPEGYSPGLVLPIDNELKGMRMKFHKSMEGSKKITLCVKNKTLQGLTYDHKASNLEIGNWDYAPPEDIPATAAGAMGSSGVKGTVVYRLGGDGVSLVVRFSFVEGEGIPIMTAEVHASSPSEIGPPDEEPHVRVTAPNGDVYLVTSRMNPETGIGRISLLLIDERFRAQLKQQREMDHWGSGPATSGFIVPHTAVDDTLVKMDLQSQRLAIVVVNATELSLIYSSDIMPSGQWRYVPAKAVGPREALVCGACPTVMFHGASGAIVLEGEGECVLVGFRQGWGEESPHQAVCHVGSGFGDGLDDDEWSDVLAEGATTACGQRVVVTATSTTRNVIIFEILTDAATPYPSPSTATVLAWLHTRARGVTFAALEQVLLPTLGGSASLDPDDLIRHGFTISAKHPRHRSLAFAPPQRHPFHGAILSLLPRPIRVPAGDSVDDTVRAVVVGLLQTLGLPIPSEVPVSAMRHWLTSRDLLLPTTTKPGISPPPQPAAYEAVAMLPPPPLPQTMTPHSSSEEMEVWLVTTWAGLRHALYCLRTCRIIAIDFEGVYFGSSNGHISVAQFASRCNRELVIQELCQLLLNPSICKVIHDVRCDSRALMFDWGLGLIENVVDVQVAHNVREPMTMSDVNLRYLVSYWLEDGGNVAHLSRIGRHEYDADPSLWDNRPLPDRLITHAATDVLHLLELWDAMCSGDNEFAEHVQQQTFVRMVESCPYVGHIHGLPQASETALAQVVRALQCFGTMPHSVLISKLKWEECFAPTCGALKDFVMRHGEVFDLGSAQTCVTLRPSAT